MHYWLHWYCPWTKILILSLTRPYSTCEQYSLFLGPSSQMQIKLFLIGHLNCNEFKKRKLQIFGDWRNSLRVWDICTYIQKCEKKLIGTKKTSRMGTQIATYYGLSLSLSLQQGLYVWVWRNFYKQMDKNFMFKETCFNIIIENH